MSRIITPRRHEDVTSHRLTCEHLDPKTGQVIERGWGFSFDCDAKGIVDIATLQPAALANFIACRDSLNSCNALVLESSSRVIHHPPVMRCDCGKTLVLNCGWENTCSCGQSFNGSGQLLAPRSQWGEETGEQGTF